MVGRMPEMSIWDRKSYFVGVKMVDCKSFCVKRTAFVFLFVFVSFFGAAEGVSLEKADWIWGGWGDVSSSVNAKAETVYFHKGFEFPAGCKPVSGEIIVTCDNEWVLFVNGKQVGESGSWQNPEKINVSKSLVIEQNAIAVKAVNTLAGPAGLILKMAVVFENGEKFEVVTDESWLSSREKTEGWNDTGFTAGSGWVKAKSAGAYGIGPWGKVAPGQKRGRRQPRKPVVYEKETEFDDEIF